MNTKEMLTNYVRAGYAGLYVTSFEEARVEAEIRAVAKEREFKFHIWSVTKGVIDCSDPETQHVFPETEEPMNMLKQFEELPEKSILVLRDFDMFLADQNPVLIRRIKDALVVGKASNRVLIIVGVTLRLPIQLEKEITVVEFKLPDRDQLLAVMTAVAGSADIPMNGNTEPNLSAASGLTTTEAENAFALSVVECQDISAEVISREKAQTIKKNGILEVVDTPLTLDDIGGIDYYKDHLWSISKCFTKEAREYGLPSPRPVICVGQPGTGKSMSAMACKNVFNLPLLRLEAGRLFGSLVGQSELNWRTAFTTAKAIAPAIFWIDEAEALFSGLQSSGSTDGGTTSRVIKAILQDMQFNGEGLFFVFTANDVDQFPDPLIDRCDLWNFELPTAPERSCIWRIHIEKRGRKIKKFNLPKLSEITEGYSGRQIEQLWLKSMMRAFNDGGREPNEKDVEECSKRFVPTSVTMKIQIERRRERLANRAQPASKTDQMEGLRPSARKLA